MIDDDAVSMYDTQDLEQSVKVPTKEIVVKKDQFTSEVKIGNHTITIINPEYVDYINQKLIDMTTKYAMLENELRNVKQESRRKDEYFNRAITKINARFGFNG